MNRTWKYMQRKKEKEKRVDDMKHYTLLMSKRNVNNFGILTNPPVYTSVWIVFLFKPIHFCIWYCSHFLPPTQVPSIFTNHFT